MSNALRYTVGDREPIMEYVQKRYKKLQFWSRLIVSGSVTTDPERAKLAIITDCEYLAECYCRYTDIGEIKVPKNRAFDDYMAFLWRLTPPYREFTGYDGRGQEIWRIRHTARIPAGNMPSTYWARG